MWLMSDITAAVLILLALALGLLAILTGREAYTATSLRGSITMLGPAVAAVDGPDSKQHVAPFITG
jgi:hypothetical protein